jgi:hypothetical protein
LVRQLLGVPGAKPCQRLVAIGERAPGRKSKVGKGVAHGSPDTNLVSADSIDGTLKSFEIDHGEVVHLDTDQIFDGLDKDGRPVE